MPTAKDLAIKALGTGALSKAARKVSKRATENSEKAKTYKRKKSNTQDKKKSKPRKSNDKMYQKTQEEGLLELRKLREKQRKRNNGK